MGYSIGRSACEFPVAQLGRHSTLKRENETPFLFQVNNCLDTEAPTAGSGLANQRRRGSFGPSATLRIIRYSSSNFSLLPTCMASMAQGPPLKPSSASEGPPKALRDRPAPLWPLWPVAAHFAVAGSRHSSARKKSGHFHHRRSAGKRLSLRIFLAAHLQFAIAPC